MQRNAWSESEGVFLIIISFFVFYIGLHAQTSFLKVEYGSRINMHIFILY